MPKSSSFSRRMLCGHVTAAGAIALIAGVSVLPGCSLLGMNKGEESSASAAKPSNKKAVASAKEAAPKSAAPSAPTSDQLRTSGSDLQSMFDAMEKAQAAKNTAPAPTPSQATASNTPNAALESSRLTPINQPVSPVLVATTQAVAPEPLPELPAELMAAPITAAPAPSPIPTTAAAPTNPVVKPSTPAPSESSLTIAAAALCSRVESFGRYTPLNSTTFMAGRPAQMILYTELAGFSQKPLEADAAQFVTELGQTVELYLDSDGSRQFVIPRQTIREATRSQRRDFYLVQRVSLPANLSVGKYNMKVRVIDIASGQETERSIPIQISADPASARIATPENRAAASAEPAH